MAAIFCCYVPSYYQQTVLASDRSFIDRLPVHSDSGLASLRDRIPGKPDDPLIATCQPFLFPVILLKSNMQTALCVLLDSMKTATHGYL